MSSHHRLKPVAPLKSALPDVFLRKNKFEERMLENKRKLLEKTEKKVIDRLAKEQEEFAILNCVCIGNGTDTIGSSETFGRTSNTVGSSSDNFESRSKGIECTSGNFGLTPKDIEKSSVGGKLVDENKFRNWSITHDVKRNEQSLKCRPNTSNSERSCAINNITKLKPKGNVHFRRSKSDTSLTFMRMMSKSELEKTPQVQKTEKSSDKTIYNEQQIDEKRALRKPPLRPTLSLPAQNGLSLGGIKTRAKSAPAQRTRVSFSGRDGRSMSLTPVIRQFGHVSLNDACSRPDTAVKTLRDLPRTAQVQLKNSVYFLSQHKIQQQNEMAKIRTRRAMSAKTAKY
ncbi:Hypothetical predicted protein [Paramuricea clavata]|uniref:Uncharacterized protein n=1 Tax=Paramuricea clavata TaxID=317549 RepID=A0A7D9IIB1_PARCT|nr:Hypothetical predicted protein [Paramuricea clavata]